MITDSRNIWMRGVIAGIFAVCCFSFFQFLLPYHLFFKEQTQLFLFTSDYFFSYFEKPAWLASFTGDFLTQFFYLRGGGAIVITIVLLIEWLLIIQVLIRVGLKKKVALFAFIPIVFEWLWHCELYYSLASSVSVIIILLTFLLYTSITNKWISLIIGVLLLPVLHNLAGGAFFLFPLLVICFEVIDGKRRWAYWILLIALSGIYPAIIRQTYLQTVKQVYRYPYVSFKINGPNFTREKILALSSEAYFGNWNKVLKLADKNKLPNTVATYYTNIALSTRNELPDKLLGYYQPAGYGLFLPVNPNSNWMDIFFSSDAFFHVGDMNMAQHSAMLGMIFSPKHRSSRMVKRLAEINLVNGDTTATRKYLRILDATLFHKRWSAIREKMLTSNGDEYPWLKSKRSLLPAYDTLRFSSDYETSLKLLVESNPDNSYALNYLLCYYLLNKNLSSFSTAYDLSYLGKSEHYPGLYYEALLIKLAASKAGQKEVERYNIPSNIVSDFMEYTRIYEESGGDIDALRDSFSSTYWFYYHFARMIKK